MLGRPILELAAGLRGIEQRSCKKRLVDHSIDADLRLLEGEAIGSGCRTHRDKRCGSGHADNGPLHDVARSISAIVAATLSGSTLFTKALSQVNRYGGWLAASEPRTPS